MDKVLLRGLCRVTDDRLRSGLSYFQAFSWLSRKSCGGAQGDKTIADKKPLPINSGTPVIRRIHFSHVTAVDVKIAAGFLFGLAEMPLEDISFTDIPVLLSEGAKSDYPEMADDIPSMSQAGFFVRNARRIRFERVDVTGQIGAAFDIDDSVSALINS